jgi:hypothetical protein
MLFGRKLRTRLPVRNALTVVQQQTREVKIESKRLQQQSYDQHAKDFEELRQYQQVLVQLNPDKRSWKPATVVQTPNMGNTGPRSYIVQTDDGGRFCRNRKHVKPSHIDPTLTKVTNKVDEPQISQPTINPQSLGRPPKTPPPPRVAPRRTPGTPMLVPDHSLDIPRDNPVVSKSPKPKTSQTTVSSRVTRTNRVPPKKWADECLLPKYNTGRHTKHKE